MFDPLDEVNAHDRLAPSLFSSIYLEPGDVVYNCYEGTHQVDSDEQTVASTAFYREDCVPAPPTMEKIGWLEA